MAQRLQQKRSSIPGRRPDSSYLDPGELAVNTNASDPGLFFEGHDGSIIKAGPTALSSEEPSTEVGYGNGEAWLNTESSILSHYHAATGEWVKTLSPEYGGSEHLVYVGSEFPEASDSLLNDGSARPFASFNRACLEIARRSILQGRSDEPTQAKYTIVLLPGTNIAHNEPGLGMQEFVELVGKFTKSHDLTLNELRAFNPVEGGIPLPRGTSIIGLDPFKSHVHPSYYPMWDRDGYDGEEEFAPRTAIFHATGDSLLNRLTFKDKVSGISVSSISGEKLDVAVLGTLEPHGLRTLIIDDQQASVLAGDLIELQYPNEISRVNGDTPSISEGLYWAEPLSETTLRLRDRITLEVVYRVFLPSAPVGGSVPNEFLNLSVVQRSHHRLSVAKFASRAVLNEYYSKVQQAFADLYFGGIIDDSEVNLAEVEIIKDLPRKPTPSVDDTTHHAPSLIDCFVKSNYGMCGVTADGDSVGGFKEFFIENFIYQSFQNDPDVFEVFYDQQWIPLKEAAWRGKGVEPIDITNEIALQYLIDHVQLENFRYFYSTSKDVPGKSDYSSGLPDPVSDTRHYAILSSNSAHVDALSCTVVGSAVGFWSQSGGEIILEDPTMDLGTESIRSEGFAGIGTAGGSLDNQKGFEVTGVRRPSIVPHTELSNEKNHKYVYLDAAVQSTTATTIVFTNPVNTHSLLPYTLRPGSVIWVTSLADGQSHFATIAAGGLSSDGLTLNVESAGNAIDALNVNHLSLPHIRRFVDPRDPSQRNYYLQVSNTSTDHEPPRSGTVLRYAENQSSTITTLLEPGRQLDPGVNGGWNHLFSVHQCLTKQEGQSPNIRRGWNAVPNQSDSYYVSLNLADSFKPWDNSVDSPRGTAATYSGRNWTAQFTSSTTIPFLPSEDKSAWALAYRSDTLQSVTEAYIPDSYSKTRDPNDTGYTPSDQYLRGIKCPEALYDDKAVIDHDDGSANLGIASSNYVLSSLIDPEATHSRRAIKRFLTLLGYDDATMDAFLQPQHWANRDFLVNQFPPLDGDGYALSVGNWPVEFVSSSSVLVTNAVWNHPGYHNISKGADRYRTSSLSKQMRFNSMRSTAWCGFVIADGQNHLGEVLPLDVDDTRNTSRIF